MFSVLSFFKSVSNKNCAKWSEIVVMSLPEIEPSSILLENMLSIRMLERGVTFVGATM